MCQVGINLLVIQIQAVQIRLNPWAERAESVDPLGTSPLSVLELQVTGGNIIANGVAQYVVLPVLGLDILRRFGNDYGKLALKLYIGGIVWDLDRGIRACLLYTSPSPRDKRQSRMPSSA